MHIKELSQSTVPLSANLNPDLWTRDEHLIESIKDILASIADKFVTDLGISKVDDVLLTGSNAGFAHSPDSTIVLAVKSPIEDDEIYKELLQDKIRQWQTDNECECNDYPVDITLVDSNTPCSCGAYSLNESCWRVIPKRSAATPVDIGFIALTESWANRIKTGNLNGWERIEKAAIPGSVESLVVRRLSESYTNATRNSFRKLPEAAKEKPVYGYGTVVEDATLTPDGVNPTTCMFLNEKDIPSKSDVIKAFTKFCIDELEIDAPPKMRLKKDPEWSARNKTFGRYTPDTNEMELGLAGRNIQDICRTLAHELVHCRQNERGELGMNSGEDGSDQENEANSIAGVIMRKWGKMHPEFFDPAAVTESASGYIPTKKQANDPRFKMAISVKEDVGALPNENSLGQPIAQTEEALRNFWRWFQGSKVVDDKGRPLVVYHGTTTQFDSFKIKDNGAFFTSNPDIASFYADLRGPVLPVYLRMRDPEILDGAIFGDSAYNMSRSWSTLVRQTKGNGYDGIIVQEMHDEGGVQDQYIIFNPTQVKSSTGNRGSFKRFNTKITHEDEYTETPDGQIIESASGYIPTKKQAKDPRYSMALTQDVRPGEIGRCANKLGLVTDKQGRPQIANPNGKVDKLAEELAIKLEKFKSNINESYVEEEPMNLVHGTVRDFDPSEFDTSPSKEMGAHFGTPDQANDFSTHEGGRNLPVVVDIKNAYEAQEDLGRWHDVNEWKRYLRDWEANGSGPLDPSEEEINALETPEDVRALLVSRGYDGIEYPNRLEGDTDDFEDNHSYIAFYPHQIKSRFVEDEIIDEVKMSPGALQKWASGPGVEGMLMGIEFEMYYPNAADDDDDDEQEPDYDQDERVHDIDDIATFFRDTEGYSSIRRRLAEAYDQWLGDALPDYVSRGWDDEEFKERMEYEFPVRDFYDDAVERLKVYDEPYDDADVESMAKDLRDMAIDDCINDQDKTYWAVREDYEQDIMDNADISESDWLNDIGVRSAFDAASEFSLTWPYWISVGGGSANTSMIADYLQQDLGYDVTGSSNYHGAARGGANWIVEPDSSLNNPIDESDAGIEIVSPPLPVNEMIEQMNALWNWANDSGCYTNSTTGLHMNISVPNFTIEKLDFIKLALFMGDEHVLRQFGRVANTYCNAATRKIKNNIKSSDITEVLNLMKTQLNSVASKIIHSGQTDKYTSINTHSGYVEFRGPGGNWLDISPDMLSATALRLAMALSIACDENAYKEEYAKKFYKLVAPGDSDDNIVSMFARYNAGEYDVSVLKNIVRQAQTTRSDKRGNVIYRGEGPFTFRATSKSGNSQPMLIVGARDEMVANNVLYKKGLMPGDFNLEVVSSTDPAALKQYNQQLADRKNNVLYRGNGPYTYEVVGKLSGARLFLIGVSDRTKVDTVLYSHGFNPSTFYIKQVSDQPRITGLKLINTQTGGFVTRTNLDQEELEYYRDTYRDDPNIRLEPIYD